MATHVLFVCGRNRWRSPTAARVFRNDQRVEVRACGLSPRSPRQLKARDLEWAEIVFVMEQSQKKRIQRQFRDLVDACEIHVLDIPDEFELMDPELVDLLQHRVGWYLDRLGGGPDDRK